MIGVIGTGPAGISAATYIKRAGIPVKVFTNHKSSLMKAVKVSNYYGTKTISGGELYQNGIDKLKELDIDIIEDTIVDIEINDNFILEGLKDKYQCEAIVLATGSSTPKLDIPGIKEFDGKGISYCTTCDGYFFKNKIIALIGTGDYAKHEYEYLTNITPTLLLFNNGNNKNNYHDEMINGTIKEIRGSNVVEKIILEDETEYAVDAIFIAGEYADSNTLSRKVGIITINDRINTDDKMMTNIPGIFACGDNTKGIKQIAKAVYEGMIAGLSAIDYLKEKEKKYEVR